MEERIQIQDEPKAATTATSGVIVGVEGGPLKGPLKYQGGAGVEGQGFAETKGGGEGEEEVDVRDQAAEGEGEGEGEGAAKGKGEGAGRMSSAAHSSVGVEYEKVARQTEALSEAMMEATAILIESAQAGFARAQNDLGYMYVRTAP